MQDKNTFSNINGDQGRDSHFFLAGWNGARREVDAGEHFKEASMTAPAEKEVKNKEAAPDGFGTALRGESVDGITHQTQQGLDAETYTMSVERAGCASWVKIPALQFSNARLQEQLLGVEALKLVKGVDAALAAQAKQGGV